MIIHRLCLGGESAANRTVPFVSKAIGVPLIRYAALVMAGKTWTN